MRDVPHVQYVGGEWTAKWVQGDKTVDEMRVIGMKAGRDEEET